MVRPLIVPFLLLLWSGGALSAQVAGPLSLDRALEIARAENPRLIGARAAADAAAARVPAARVPPDPQLRIGAMNTSLPGLRADMPSSMLPAIEVMQMIPVAGKLRLGGRIAELDAERSRLLGEEEWLQVRAAVTEAFHEIHRIDGELEAMRETAGWLADAEQVATALYAAGQGRQNDVLRAGIEQTRMRGEIARMEAMRYAAAARLNTAMGRAATAEVAGVVLPLRSSDLPAIEVLRALSEANRPMLAEGRLGVEQARARRDLAERELWPDLSVGVQYGQRAGEMGTERMGSLMLGVTVPVFAGRRQMQMRSEAAAMERMSLAELQSARAEIDGALAALHAAITANGALIELLRSELLPQAEASISSSLAGYRAGRLDFMTVLDARMSANAFRRELVTLEAERGALIAELEMTIGVPLPLSTPNTLEAA